MWALINLLHILCCAVRSAVSPSLPLPSSRLCMTAQVSMASCPDSCLHSVVGRNETDEFLRLLGDAVEGPFGWAGCIEAAGRAFPGSSASCSGACAWAVGCSRIDSDMG